MAYWILILKIKSITNTLRNLPIYLEEFGERLKYRDTLYMVDELSQSI